MPLPATDDCVYRILTAERDAIMAHSLRAVADVEGPSKTVVAVVGGFSNT
jgi:pheromone shutdown protein TraB